MSKLQNSSITVPVYIFPKSFQFIADDPNSYNQKATLFNPYDFSIKFKVLSTAPQKYLVAEPTGIIKSKCCVDLIIKHHSSAFMNENITDKLRVQIYQINRNNNEISNSNLVGKKDISLYSIVSRENYENLMNTEINFNDLALENNSYSSFSHGNNLNAMMGLNSNNSANINNINKNRLGDKNIPINRINASLYPNNDSVSYLVIFVGLICLVIMFLPLVNSETKLPSYFQISFEVKLFASFVLGMVTMVILKA